MAIDPKKIEMTTSQKKRLVNLAEREGKGYAEVLDALLSSNPLVNSLANIGTDSLSTSQGTDSQQAVSQQTAYDALAAIGAIGCIQAPSDLSTNPKYMEGFGTHANSSNPD